MKQEFRYLLPDYYTSFSCKMGACRSACCVGWPISFSVDDYFLLMGMDCDAEMRNKLDRGVRLCLTPTRDHYAQIVPRYDGECYMRMEDGRCHIHALLGENALPQVCRLYPRGIRTQPDLECSCANSCERVLELLFDRQEPLRFEYKELPSEPPKQEKRIVSFPTMGKEQEIRLWLIGQLQNRQEPLWKRIVNLGTALEKLEKVLESKNVDALMALITTTVITDFTTDADTAFGFETAKALVLALVERSEGFKQYGEAALKSFEGNNGQALYEEAAKQFAESFPDREKWFENMLVNHMFFEQFPYHDRPDTLFHKLLAICALYAVLRFVCVGYMKDKTDREPLVDVCAATFRLVEHTSFYRYSARIFESLDCKTPDKLLSILKL